MRIAVFADNHWCQYSSILRGRGEKYSLRLENQIDSLVWLEATAIAKQCDFILCLGDFFDKSTLNAEELSALEEVYGRGRKLLPHQFIVGNHEAVDGQLSYSSVSAMNMLPKWEYPTVVAMPLKINFGGIEVCYLPYQPESDRKPIRGIFGDCEGKGRIIFSHNDIAGVQYGNAISKFGYTIEEIEESCDLFVNGHIHNGGKIGKKIVNLGNFTGQNFSEDATKYSHRLMIIDTDTLSYETIDNPRALNFYKLDFHKTMPTLKERAVVTLRVKEEDIDKAKEWLNNPNILASRIVVDISKGNEYNATESGVEAIDHLAKFREFVHANIGVSQAIDEELELVGAVANEH